MILVTNIFKGKIKCLNCGKNYKKKMERKQVVFVCSGFANYGKEFCSYNPIKQEDLLYTIQKHIDLSNKKVDKLEEYISLIEVKGKGYKVTYKDGSESLINWGDDEYGIKVMY